MATRCPDCDIENADDALVCTNCGFRFLDLELKDELFFPYEEGKAILRRDISILNRAGLEVLIEIGSDIPAVIITPPRAEIPARGETKIFVSLDTTELDPDTPLQGNLTVSVPDNPGYSVDTQILFGRPPKPEIQPGGKIELGDVFEGTVKELVFRIANKQAGVLMFQGYRGDWVDQKTYDEVVPIQDKYDLSVQLDLSGVTAGPFETQITFVFGDGVASETVDISANIAEGPKLQGEVKWNIWSEQSGVGWGEKDIYVKDPKEMPLSNSTRGPVTIDMGMVPVNVRTQIHIHLENPSPQGYMASMTISDSTSGLSVGFGEEAVNKITMNLAFGETYEGFIMVVAENEGIQDFEISLSYDRKDYGLPELSFVVSLFVIEAKNSKKYFGIDLGTSNSCISYFDGQDAKAISVDNVAEVYEHFNNTGDIPYLYSFCCYPNQNRSDKHYVGRYAEELAVIRDSVGIKSVKTKLGTGWFISVGGERVYARDVARIILDELIARARDNTFGLQPRNAIITITANSSLKKIEDTRESYRRAGINVSDDNVIYEPEAATYYYLLGTDEGKRQIEGLGDAPIHILTFDFGGGTLDISVVRLQRKELDTGEKIEIGILKSVGRNLGGDDMDWALRRLAVSKSKLDKATRELYSKRVSELRMELQPKVRSDRLILMRECETAKIHFSDPKADSYTIQAPADFEGVKITRDEHDKVCKTDIIGGTHGAQRFVAEAIQSTELDIRDIDTVIMAGGSSFMLPVQHMMHDMFDKKRVKFLGEEAKTAVSMGATLYVYETQQPSSMYKFSKVKPQIDARIGYMTQVRAGRKFREIFPQGTLAHAKSQKVQKPMPQAGIYTLVVAKNKGVNDDWNRSNEGLERVSERSFDGASPGETITEWFELDEIGNLIWCIQYSGGTKREPIEILDSPMDDDNDPGF